MEGQADQNFIYVSGDAYWNAVTNGDIVAGGDDTLTVSAFVVSGDVYFSDAGTKTTGGNDRITLLQALNDTEYEVAGDMLSPQGDVTGGDDRIVGYIDEIVLGRFYGDAECFRERYRERQRNRRK